MGSEFALGLLENIKDRTLTRLESKKNEKLKKIMGDLVDNTIGFKAAITRIKRLTGHDVTELIQIDDDSEIGIKMQEAYARYGFDDKEMKVIDAFNNASVDVDTSQDPAYINDIIRTFSLQADAIIREL